MVTKRILEGGVDPLLKALFHHHNRSVETVDAESENAEPSEFARVNGKPPRNEKYRAHAAEDFANWTPTVGGLVVGLMAKYGSPRIRDHGIPEAMEAIWDVISTVHGCC